MACLPFRQARTHLCSNGSDIPKPDSAEGTTAHSVGLRRGGLRFGALTGLFYGIQLLSSTARNRRDMADTIYAALATGAVMGTFSARLQPMHAWLPSRTRYAFHVGPFDMLFGITMVMLPVLRCAVSGSGTTRFRSAVLGAALGGLVRTHTSSSASSPPLSTQSRPVSSALSMRG